MQAPIVWDAEDAEDTRTAKHGCNGYPSTLDSIGAAPCPIRRICLDAALIIETDYGVWGGKAPHERRKLLKIFNDVREIAPPTGQYCL